MSRKLSKQTWNEIRLKYLQGTPIKDLSKEYNISRQGIHSYSKRNSWGSHGSLFQAASAKAIKDVETDLSKMIKSQLSEIAIGCQALQVVHNKMLSELSEAKAESNTLPSRWAALDRSSKIARNLVVTLEKLGLLDGIHGSSIDPLDKLVESFFPSNIINTQPQQNDTGKESNDV